MEIAIFDELCSEMLALGILEGAGKNISFSKEFPRRTIALFTHPINDEAKKTARDDPKDFLHACVLSTLIGYYGSISRARLKPRWEIIDSLFPELA